MSARSLSMDDFFPPEGHRYFTDERIESLRQIAMDEATVTLDSFTVMELICDWRNMMKDLARASGESGSETE